MIPTTEHGRERVLAHFVVLLWLVINGLLSEHGIEWLYPYLAYKWTMKVPYRCNADRLSKGVTQTSEKMIMLHIPNCP
jgi:hypothetical protein